MYVDGLREAYGFISRGYHDQTTQAQFTYFQTVRVSDIILPKSLTMKQTLAGCCWVSHGMDVIYQLVLRLTTAEKTITRNMTGRPTGLWSGGQTMMHRLQILTVASAADDSGTSHDTHGTTSG